MPVYSVKTIIRKKKNWKGTKDKVYFRVLVSSERRYYSANISGDARFFNSKTGEFKSHTPDVGKNNSITQKRGDILKLLNKLELEKGEFSIYDFHKNYYRKNGDAADETLVDFIKDEIKLRTNSSTRTIQIYKTTIMHLEGFRKSVKIEHVDFDFLSRFHAYLMSAKYDKSGEMTKPPMINNTANMYLKKLRVFIRLAINKKKMAEADYPFRFYPLKDDPTWRDFLEEQQVHTIMNLENLKPYQEETRRRFVFQCYTGLRFSDLNIKWSEIRGESIIRPMIKVNETVSIPLVPNARKVIGPAPEDLTQRIFKPITNQKYNEFLKEIATLAGIELNLTSHVARHTFATLALTYGMSTETVQAILGQKSVKTTQIYAKIVNKKIEAEMKRFTL
jgi:integrase/recombinase XerD